MEYTEQQRSQFRQAYAVLCRKQFAIWSPYVLILVAFGLGDDPKTETVLGLPYIVASCIFLGFLVVASVLSARNWRCPACNNYLGKALNPKHCKHCGAELRNSMRSAVR